MAYGKGQTKDLLKRMADLGRPHMSADLTNLRTRCLDVTGQMARAGFTAHVSDPVPDGKALDAVMLRLQKQLTDCGAMNNIWIEKCRLLAKSAIMEQMKRRQRNLFGRFRHIDATGDRPLPDGTTRLINLPEDWSYRLDAEDVAVLKTLAETMDFREAMGFFGQIHAGEKPAHLTNAQRDALIALMDQVQERFQCPVWDPEAVIQLHLDYRCIKGAKRALTSALEEVGGRLDQGRPVARQIALASHIARGAGISLEIRLVRCVARNIHEHQDPDRPYRMTGLALELGPEVAQLRGILARPKATMDLSEITHVVAEDFGLVNTSSLVVLELPGSIDPEVLPTTNKTKAQSRKYLSDNVSGADIRLVESLQLSGRNFLARINEMAVTVDQLRSEIDLNYNRLDRIRREINRLLGRDPRDMVEEIAPAAPRGLNTADTDRLMRMHRRFFRLIGGIGKMKARRRGIYRSLAGLKKSWFGHIANIRMRLASKYRALVVSEKLDYLAIPTDETGYKGRTFNRMINNGARAQYTSRADNKLDWRGIPQIKIPAFYTSCTDWRNGHVDKAQRRGEVFTAAVDRERWHADLHAAEMIGRWLFLRPRNTVAQAAA
ncbi:hypothetical protein [Pseudosulfitobacter pseudonitzschiae]|uniref:hypothetical protein n=1 Tax=Pseudosulfitobacter pseudonitzschiae TaxID=1402135 RepID=UPI003B7CA2CB